MGEVSKLRPWHRSPYPKRSRPEGHSPSSQRSRQEGSPSPSRDHGKENLTPPKLPRKLRPRRRREKHHIPGSSQTGSQPRTSGSPGSAMRAPVKHPLTSPSPQHPQPPSPAANHNSSRNYLQDHSESQRVYKPAQPSIQQDSTTRSHQDSF